MRLFLLDSYVSSFRETSYDKVKKESLLMDDRKKIVNYDAYAASVSQEFRIGENLSSADGLAVSGEEILLIEFKNQKLSQIDAKRIQKKAFDSLFLFFLLQGLETVSVAEIKGRVSFLVLYREDDIPSFSRWNRKVSRLTGEEVSPHFGLEKYRRFYKRILTLTAEEFFSSETFHHISEF